MNPRYHLDFGPDVLHAPELMQRILGLEHSAPLLSDTYHLKAITAWLRWF